MRAYLAKLTPKAWALLAIVVTVIAYPLVTMVVPAAIRAAVPEVVRSVLRLI
ncbi:MAG: hypothetical protein WCA20_37050 [Candidatus Sulfotelmatobacter sp.]